MQDSFLTPDSSTTGVTAWPEPVILGSACGSRSQSRVRRPVDGLAQHMVEEQWVIRNHSRGKIVLHFVEDLEHILELFVAVRNYHLERSEELGGAQVEILQKGLHADLHRSRFVATVYLGNLMVGQLLTSKSQRGLW